ncbi:MAG: integrase arm-type DNA-binding domain-containing protein [Pseudomonadota bacterium]|nr:integrase arm-type DNA-binding domain-containing protein [Pseudomonadota bacterium]
MAAVGNPINSRQPDGERNRLTFGSYPAVSVFEARQKHLEARRSRVNGVDPAQARRIAKQAKAVSDAQTFAVVAFEWHTNKAETWKEATAKAGRTRVENDVFPCICRPPIGEVDAPFMLMLKQVEKRGALQMAARLAQ